TEEAFRLRGFRKLKDDWVEFLPGSEADSGSDKPKATPTPAATSQGLLGLTADEVRLKMNGRPPRGKYPASKGQPLQRWIYHLDNHSARYVNLLRAPGSLKPRVVADYTLPRITPKGGFGSAR